MQADEVAPQRFGQDLGDFRLADARLTFQQQRAAHVEREVYDRRQVPPGNVVAGSQQAGRSRYVAWQFFAFRFLSHLVPGRRVLP